MHILAALVGHSCVATDDDKVTVAVHRTGTCRDKGRVDELLLSDQRSHLNHRIILKELFFEKQSAGMIPTAQMLCLVVVS